MKENKKIYSIGRTKKAIAQIIMQTGLRKLSVNNKTLLNYCLKNQLSLYQFYKFCNIIPGFKNYNIQIKVKGSGFKSQMQAIIYAFIKIVRINFANKWSDLKKKGYKLNMWKKKERKKYGLKKARKAPQFSKR